jgi:exopolysaccharide biosynthesis WecB/TagA/CpsF family protein
MKKTTKIAGIAVQIGSVTSVMRRIESDLKRNFGGYSIAANMEKAFACRADQQFADIVKAARFVVADGFPFSFLATLKSIRRTRRVDLPKETLSLAARLSLPVYLLGGRANVIEKAAESAAAIFDCDVVGYCDGYSTDEDKIIQQIAAVNPRIVLVGMGSPRQELFVSKASKTLPEVFFVPCGGALDIIAGVKRRAPRLIRRVGLEWAYRMNQEPERAIRFWNKLIRK